MTLRVVIMRHPPVAVQGIIYGQMDVPLIYEAEREIPRLAADPLVLRAARAWCSPWQRARVVGHPLAQKLGLDITEDARLAELGFGQWEGRSLVDLEHNEGILYKDWMDNWDTFAAPGGESVGQMVARVDDWLREQFQHRRDMVHLVVAHGGVVRAMRTISRRVTFRVGFEPQVQFLTPELIEFDDRCF